MSNKIFRVRLFLYLADKNTEDQIERYLRRKDENKYRKCTNRQLKKDKIQRRRR